MKLSSQDHQGGLEANTKSLVRDQSWLGTTAAETKPTWVAYEDPGSDMNRELHLLFKELEPDYMTKCDKKHLKYLR
jgi:hypothetical protein